MDPGASERGQGQGGRTVTQNTLGEKKVHCIIEYNPRSIGVAWGQILHQVTHLQPYITLYPSLPAGGEPQSGTWAQTAALFPCHLVVGAS